MSLRSLLLFLTSTAYRSSNWWRRRRRRRRRKRRIVSIIGRWGPFLSLFPPLSSLSFPIRFVISFDFILMKKKTQTKQEISSRNRIWFFHSGFVMSILSEWSATGDRFKMTGGSPHRSRPVAAPSPAAVAVAAGAGSIPPIGVNHRIISI